MITTDLISRALGDAVVRMWAAFPTTCKVDCSMDLFPKNEDMKPDLTLLLHEQHPAQEQANNHVLSFSPIHWAI